MNYSINNRGKIVKDYSVSNQEVEKIMKAIQNDRKATSSMIILDYFFRDYKIVVKDGELSMYRGIDQALTEVELTPFQKDLLTITVKIKIQLP